MGYALRPVVEQWGESVSWSGSMDEHDKACGLIAQAAFRAGSESQCHQYDELSVVWIENGKAFLDFLKARDWKPVPGVAEDEVFDLDQEEIRLLNSMADMWAEWTDSIDPVDGSLRFYVD